MKSLLKKVTIFDPQSTYHQKVMDVLIEDGKIAAIDPEIQTSSDVFFDLENSFISPGFVDVLADYCDPGYEHHETIDTGIASASSGGFTHVFLVPNTQPVVDHAGMAAHLKSKGSNSPVTIHPIGAATSKLEGKSLSEMLDMHHQGAIAFGDGWQPVQNLGLLQKVLEYLKAFEGVCIQLPIQQSLVSNTLMHEGERSTSLGMPGMPEMAETIMIQNCIELLRYTNSRLHISGLSSAKSVQLIDNAKAEGLQITCSVTPYHLALTDEVLVGYDSVYKVNPPIRSEYDRLELIKGLSTGIIDCIATHHQPQDWDAKNKEFEYAGWGMNIQELAFPILQTYTDGLVKPERLIDALAIRPREIFNLKSATIAVNNFADIVVYQPQNTTNLQSQHRKSLSSNNPFFNRELKGKILGVINSKSVDLKTFI